MKAIILCAGQGRRLLPYTESISKCLLSLNHKHFIEWQIDTLLSAGIRQVVAVTGYAAERVESLLRRRYAGKITVVYNPFYELADNLASCWMARHHFANDFIILNGDTLFEPGIISRLSAGQAYSITLATDHKDSYDDDDMKVITMNQQLKSVGKKLPLKQVNGESIGIMYFDPDGAQLFKAKLETSMYKPESLKKWYLTVIDELVGEGRVGHCSIHGMDWAEVDFVQDLQNAQTLVDKWSKPEYCRPD